MCYLYSTAADLSEGSELSYWSAPFPTIDAEQLFWYNRWDSSPVMCSYGRIFFIGNPRLGKTSLTTVARKVSEPFHFAKFSDTAFQNWIILTLLAIN